MEIGISQVLSIISASVGVLGLGGGGILFLKSNKAKANAQAREAKANARKRELENDLDEINAYKLRIKSLADEVLQLTCAVDELKRQAKLSEEQIVLLRQKNNLLEFENAKLKRSIKQYQKKLESKKKSE